jgi:hypothetical protein
MVRNEIDNVRITSVGFKETVVPTDEGDMFLPSNFYMEIEVDNDTFVVPVTADIVNNIENAIKSSADYSSDALAKAN